MIDSMLVKTIYNEACLRAEALRLLEFTSANLGTYICLLHKCARIKALATGKQVHAHYIKNSSKLSNYLGNMLVHMYAKCESIPDSRRLFDRLSKSNPATWNSLIEGYANHNSFDNAFKLFFQMLEDGVNPRKVTFIWAIHTCAKAATLPNGKRIHALILKTGMEVDAFLGSTIIHMYAKCGALESAKQMFYRIPLQDVVLWSTMIAGFSDHGCLKEALELFQQMREEGVKVDVITMVNVVSVCTRLASLKQGKVTHCHIGEIGLELDLFVGNSLVEMYAKTGSIAIAHQVFDRINSHNLVSWNVLIAGYAQLGHVNQILLLLQRMQHEGFDPDSVTFVSALNACTNMAALEEGRLIHGCLRRTGFKFNLFVANSLIDMYAKCGSLVEAFEVFEQMPARDVVSWNAMIAGYARHGHGKEAVQLFKKMQQEEEGVKPDGVTFISLLSACKHSGLVDEGRYYFDFMGIHGIALTEPHYACMVSLLGCAGCLDEAVSLIQSMPFQPSADIWKALLAASTTHANSHM